MNNLKYFFIILSAIVYCSPIHAQSPSMTNTYTYYGVRQGLVQSQVMCGFQDSFGYLWFGTKSGISRFDGKNFKNYRSGVEIKTGQIQDIDQYKDIVFAVKSRQILFFHPDGEIEEIAVPDNYVLTKETYYEDRYIYLFNCSQNTPNEEQLHYFIFDLETRSFTKSKDKIPNYTGYVFKTPDGLLVFCGRNQKDAYLINGVESSWLYQISVKGDVSIAKINDAELIASSWLADDTYDIYFGTLNGQQIEKKFLHNSQAYVHKALKLNEDTYYIAESRSFGSMLLKDGKIAPLPVSTLIVNDAFLDRDNNLWLCTEEGVFNCYNLKFEAFTLGFGRNDFIWDIRKDIYGNIWTSSYGLGVWRTSPEYKTEKSRVFLNGKPIRHDFVNMNGCEDALHRLYFTSNGGLMVYDPRKGNNTNLTLLEMRGSLAAFYDSLTNTVFSGDIKGSEYLLSAIDTDFNIKSYGFNLGHIISICRDANQRLRIGTFRGGAYLDEERGKIVVDTLPRPYKSIISMTLDKKGILWLAGMEGLYAEYKDGRQEKIQDGQYVFICNYRDRWLLFGGIDNQLHVLDLQEYHKEEHIVVRSFDHYNGYDALEGGQNGVYADRDGYVWTMGGDKVLKFRPDEIMKMHSSAPLKPFIGAIYSADKNLNWQLIKDNTAGLDSEDNNLRFDILQASISAPDKLKFRYRLNGYSDKWIETRENAIVFQNVPYKRFYIEVQSSIRNNVWSDSVFSQAVEIRKPFLLSFWGLLLIGVSIIFILGLSMSLFYRYWIRKKEKEHRVEQLRNRAVKSKYIPHFTGNVLNSINYLIEKDKDLAQRYISDFAGFNRQTMLNTEKLGRPLYDELKFTEQYLHLEKLRFEDRLEYSTVVAPNIDTSTVVPVMLLHTFCENAIKHGFRHKESTGHLKIEVYKKDENIVLAVEDDGIGRKRAKELKTAGTGEGLSIIEQQINFLNKYNKKKAHIQIADLADNKGEPLGTRFEFYLPDYFIINV